MFSVPPFQMQVLLFLTTQAARTVQNVGCFDPGTTYCPTNMPGVISEYSEEYALSGSGCGPQKVN